MASRPGRQLIMGVAQGIDWGTAVAVGAGDGLVPNSTGVLDGHNVEQLLDDSLGQNWRECVQNGRETSTGNVVVPLRFAGNLWRLLGAIFGDDNVRTPEPKIEVLNIVGTPPAEGEAISGAPSGASETVTGIETDSNGCTFIRYTSGAPQFAAGDVVTGPSWTADAAAVYVPSATRVHEFLPDVSLIGKLWTIAMQVADLEVWEVQSAKAISFSMTVELGQLVDVTIELIGDKRPDQHGNPTIYHGAVANGPFAPADAIQGSISGATGTVTAVSPTFADTLEYTRTAGQFVAGEEVFKVAAPTLRACITDATVNDLGTIGAVSFVQADICRRTVMRTPESFVKIGGHNFPVLGLAAVNSFTLGFTRDLEGDFIVGNPNGAGVDEPAASGYDSATLSFAYPTSSTVPSISPGSYNPDLSGRDFYGEIRMQSDQVVESGFPFFIVWQFRHARVMDDAIAIGGPGKLPLTLDMELLEDQDTTLTDLKDPTDASGNNTFAGPLAVWVQNGETGPYVT